jgi:hypothetical protein
MEEFEVHGVDTDQLQKQADRQFAKLMESHRTRAFDSPPLDGLFRPVLPWADDDVRDKGA